MRRLDANDETALGLLVGATGRGLRVPEDLVIAGFDDRPMAALASPAPTPVRQPVRARTARLMLQVAAGGADQLETDLVIRAGCGCSTGTDST